LVWYNVPEHEPNNMIKLEESYRYADREYRLKKQKGNIGLYLSDLGIEVLVYTARPKTTFSKEKIENDKEHPVVHKPTTCDWGINAFTYIDEKLALEKFEELINSDKFFATEEELFENYFKRIKS